MHSSLKLPDGYGFVVWDNVLQQPADCEPVSTHVGIKLIVDPLDFSVKYLIQKVGSDGFIIQDQQDFYISSNTEVIRQPRFVIKIVKQE